MSMTILPFPYPIVTTRATPPETSPGGNGFSSLFSVEHSIVYFVCLMVTLAIILALVYMLFRICRRRNKQVAHWERAVDELMDERNTLIEELEEVSEMLDMHTLVESWREHYHQEHGITAPPSFRRPDWNGSSDSEVDIEMGQLPRRRRRDMSPGSINPVPISSSATRSISDANGFGTGRGRRRHRRVNSAPIAGPSQPKPSAVDNENLPDPSEFALD